MNDNERKVGLFEEVDPSDREGLFLKAGRAAKWIKGFAIFNIVLLLLLGFLFLYATHKINSASISIDGMTIAPMSEYLLIVITIGTLISTFVFWYSGKLQENFRDREIPPLRLPYAILTIKIILQVYDLTQRVNWIGIIINLFICYLWYLIIDCVVKLNRVE